MLADEAEELGQNRVVCRRHEPKDAGSMQRQLIDQLDHGRDDEKEHGCSEEPPTESGVRVITQALVPTIQSLQQSAHGVQECRISVAGAAPKIGTNDVSRRGSGASCGVCQVQLIGGQPQLLGHPSLFTLASR